MDLASGCRCTRVEAARGCLMMLLLHLLHLLLLLRESVVMMMVVKAVGVVRKGWRHCRSEEWWNDRRHQRQVWRWTFYREVLRRWWLRLIVLRVYHFRNGRRIRRGSGRCVFAAAAVRRRLSSVGDRREYEYAGLLRADRRDGGVENTLPIVDPMLLWRRLIRNGWEGERRHDRARLRGVKRMMRVMPGVVMRVMPGVMMMMMKRRWKREREWGELAVKRGRL